ncbi:MAG TPA: dTDP-4-dehydrorhamnose 3,5-epimerase [Prosthecobacter sp.]|jgi:dTDP-4-dehydrorhamnose 3,5-epimerase|nr:dTDP-4-dehydrorhamnose 3,5-epimerase [Prosthecobacter sp.]
MPFSFRPLDIPELILITPELSEDVRGVFSETFKSSVFKENGIVAEFVQDNYSISKRGVVRGLHYQLNPSAQGKLIRVVKGAVFDVAVDIRQGSPHFGNWVGVHLSAENHDMLWVPPGFAHGMCALENDAELVYKVTAEHSPQHERGIVWNDPAIGVKWPVAHPVLSAKDSALPEIRNAEMNFFYEQANSCGNGQI